MNACIPLNTKRIRFISGSKPDEQPNRTFSDQPETKLSPGRFRPSAANHGAEGDAGNRPLPAVGSVPEHLRMTAMIRSGSESRAVSEYARWFETSAISIKYTGHSLEKLCSRH